MLNKKEVSSVGFEAALTVKERIDIYEKYGILNQNYIQLQEWMQTRGVITEEDIYKMLEIENISVEEFNRGLKVLSEEEKSIIQDEVEKVNWVKNYKEIMKLYIERGEVESEKLSDLDLSLSITPFILWAGEEVNRTIKNLKNISVSPKAAIKLMDKFASILLSLSIKTLVWELHNYGEDSKKLEGNKEKSDEKFKNFVKDTFVNKENLIKFYDKYPVIARRLTVKCTEIVNHFIEMFLRLDGKYKEICDELSIRSKSNIITDINCDQGDTHQQGRFVIRLEIGDQLLVYKPRDLRIQQRLFEFIDYLNKNSGMLDLFINNAFYGENYTFEAFVEYKSCTTNQQVINFYKRFGQICSVIYVLTGNDIHYENIIAHSEYPVIIDVETLFQQKSNIINFDNNAFYKAYRECIDSICGTALMPIITFAKDNKSKGVDISALNGSEQTLPYKMLSIKDANTDNMRFDYCEVKLNASNNIPMLNDEKTSFINYINYIIEGFEEGLGFVYKNKEEFAGENGVLNVFKGVTVRHLLKSTQSYAKMMAYSSHPNYSENMIKLERMFSNIWSFNYRDKRVISFEVADMIGGDIPIFYGKVDSTDIITSRGDVINNYFAKSSFEKTIKNISNLSKHDILKQIAQIKVSLGLYESLNENIIRERKEKKVEIINIDIFKEDKVLLLKEAEIIAERILKEVICEKNSQTVTWNNVFYDDINECWKVRPLDDGLSHSLSGLLMFFYALNRYTKKKEYKEIIEKILFSISNYPLGNSKLDAYEGIASVIYPLSIIYKDTKDKGIYMQIYKVSKMLNDKLDTLETYELLNGHSGIVKIMLNVYNLTKENMYLDIAEKSVNKILENVSLESSENTDISMGHGLAGIYYTLKKFNEEKRSSRIEEFCKTALEIINKYEKQLNANSWESGLSGILLAKMNLKDIDVNESTILMMEDISSIYEFDDTLATGIMGTVELLLKYYNDTSDVKARRSINKIISGVISQRNLNKDYNFNTIDGYTSVGLFNGLSGIGYTFLRLYNNIDTPDVLNLEI